jgi:hypothetical protein
MAGLLLVAGSALGQSGVGLGMLADPAFQVADLDEAIVGAPPAWSEMSGLIFPPDWKEGAKFLDIKPSRNLPASYDWRTYGMVTSVKAQGCGDCWAFSTLGAVESKILIDYGVSTNLSEQWLVSCTDAGDCSGGSIGDALEYLKCCGDRDPCNDYGAVLEAYFSYRGWEYPCYCPYPHPYCLYDWFYVGDGNSVPSVAQIKQAIYDYGPVAAGVYTTNAWNPYPSGFPDGVFGPTGCVPNSPNHGIVLVGWDDNYNGHGVWILKNSWGAGWGYNGYMYIEYNCSNVGFGAAIPMLTPTRDCNNNGIPDGSELCEGTVPDCNLNSVPDDCELAGNDCNTNGIPDDCDLSSGTSLDCNTNSVPDECDVASGTSSDCNLDGIPDECQLEGRDCNTNGVLDECDISSGTSPDCNTNSVPDECDFLAAIDVSSGPLSPIGDGYPQVYTLDPAPLALGNVMLDFQAYGDFNWSSENVAVSVDGVPIGTVLEGGSTCAQPPDEDSLTVPMATWNTAAADGVVVIDMVATSLVNAFECPQDSWISVRVQYAGESASKDCNTNGVPDECDIAACAPGDPACDDCNTNGVPDACDIASGFSQDTNGNGIPDECESGTTWCLGDSNCSGGAPGFEDIPFFVSALTGEVAWEAYHLAQLGVPASCPYGVNDMDGGGVSFQDIAPFVNALGAPCVPY